MHWGMPIVTSLSYLTAFMLTGLFIQTFDVWQALALALGPDNAALVPFAGFAALVAASLAGRRRPRPPLPLLCGLAAAGIALALTDPAFPAKRIHVAEYMLLAFVIRFGAARIAAGLPLSVIVAVLTMLLGVHDELIQGLHPDRSFGLRDILVDGLAAAAGALLGHAPATGDQADNALPWTMAMTLPLAGLALELWAVWAICVHDGDKALAVPPPLWATAPVLGAVLAALLLAPKGVGWPAHLGRMVMVLAGITPLYLVLPHVAPLAFR